MRSEEVLLVDDSSLLREMVAGMLRRYGYQVHEASSAEEGLTLFKDKNIALVITDLSLGRGQNGVDFLNVLATLRPGLKAIMISGIILPGQSVRFRFPVLAKPFTFQDLLSLVESVLDERSSAADAGSAC